MSILAPNAEEIEALASREELKEIQFSESPDRTALETLELRILRHRPDYEVRFYGFLNGLALCMPDTAPLRYSDRF